MFEFFKDTWRKHTRRVEAEPVEPVMHVEAANNADGPIAETVGEEMAQLGTELAESAAPELPLDFTPASLPVADRLLATSRRLLATAPADRREQEEDRTSLRIGAYVGEVIRRAEGGAWTRDPDGLPLLLVADQRVETVLVVFALLTEGYANLPGGPVATLADYFKHVDLAQRVSVEAIVRGPHRTLDELMKAMTDDGDLAPWLLAETQSCVKMARVKWNVTLDFSPRSLDAVDSVLAQLHAQVASPAADPRTTDRVILGAAITWGTYVGEVFRRHCGGKWRVDPVDGAMQVQVGDTVMLPLTRVQKRVMDGPDDAVPLYFDAIDIALRQSEADPAAA